MYRVQYKLLCNEKLVGFRCNTTVGTKDYLHSQGRSSCHKECPYNYTEYIIKVFLITEKSDIKLLMNELYRILSYGKIKEK